MEEEDLTKNWKEAGKVAHHLQRKEEKLGAIGDRPERWRKKQIRTRGTSTLAHSVPSRCFTTSVEGLEGNRDLRLNGSLSIRGTDGSVGLRSHLGLTVKRKEKSHNNEYRCVLGREVGEAVSSPSSHLKRLAGAGNPFYL